MPGALDSAFRKAAESVVKDLATGLDVEIDYVREVSGEYNVATGTYTDLRQTFADIRAPIEVINSEGENGAEERRARVYIAPDQINDNQPTVSDEITLKFQGSDRKAQIVDIRTFGGGQNYLYILAGGVLMTLVNAWAVLETAIENAVTTADSDVTVVFDNMPFTVPGKTKSTCW